ncbi:chemotaxis protein CheA [Piscirickettsia litoralis]|uniref:chemotaxis protein CheA n=1 Tax=Piscirickettsia litoralis TaxID=1891921 RepID=UPI000B09A634|nr:chemotaxis protein CheW [Piscirickettsia litoralis]
MPEDRVNAGKPAEGSVSLNAFHQGGKIVIEVSDDGQGLNRERICEKAVEKGLISSPELMSDDEVYDLIFNAGFSTAESLSELSGRGVGMDVVRKNITALGGNIKVTSTPGEGACFRIQLPLTLAILDGQQVRVGKQIYIVPLISIIESLKIDVSQVKAVSKQHSVYQLRDDYIPIIELGEVFDVSCDDKDFSQRLLVIAEVGTQMIGIVVDELLAQQQIVIKNLEDHYRKVPGLSGATILGDGHVALILEVADLINMQADKINEIKLSTHQSGITTPSPEAT